MNHNELQRLLLDLLIVLSAGFAAGVACKRWGMSLLVGYLLVGTLIGEGGLHLVRDQRADLELLAKTGVLLLLFAVGLEFSLDELRRLLRFFLLGGAVQMALVAGPLTVAAHWAGLSPAGALLAGSAGALSSTVLVFKALSECGHSATEHGRRTLGILLFQDVALVPLLLLVPLLIGGKAPSVLDVVTLLAKSAMFIAAVGALRVAMARWLMPQLAKLRSVELVVLFAVGVLTCVGLLATRLDLPAAVGALAAGLMLSGQRLTRQIDTILLPFRESFSAVFFVTLGMLLRPAVFFETPVLLASGLIGMLTLKSLSAAIALRITGLNWKSSFGMGLCLSQIGEFSFLLAAEGVQHKLISDVDYSRMLFIALGTLFLTPWLLRLGLRCAERDVHPAVTGGQSGGPSSPEDFPRAIVIGTGPIGRRVATLLETSGCEVCVIDLSPINLYPFAQQGFPTVAGDARDTDILREAELARSRLLVISVPDDEVARDIVISARQLSSAVPILVRCRFETNLTSLLQAGANAVVSEEVEAAERLKSLSETLLASPPMTK